MKRETITTLSALATLMAENARPIVEALDNIIDCANLNSPNYGEIWADLEPVETLMIFENAVLNLGAPHNAWMLERLREREDVVERLDDWAAGRDKNIRFQPGPCFSVGDKAIYRGDWGKDMPKQCTITGIGTKNDRVVYDNDLGHWGYADQYAIE